MAADYLISSLPPLPFDGPAPLSADGFCALCAEQLGDASASAVRAVMVGGASDHPLARAWADLDGQLKNALAAARARSRGEDPAKWIRPTAGCSLHWAGRMGAAYAEKDVVARDRAIDRVRWDAAGELVPAAAPLSEAAAFAYAVRLAIVLRRARASSEEGAAVFARLTAAPTDLETLSSNP